MIFHKLYPNNRHFIHRRFLQSLLQSRHFPDNLIRKFNRTDKHQHIEDDFTDIRPYLPYVDTFYYDAEGNMKFRLLQRVIDEEADSDVMIDNENDPVTTIYVNGNEGILVEYPDVPGLYYLVWQDSYYQYSLYGSFSSVAELMKIAEGIKTE